MERCHPQYGITGSDIDTRRRTQTWSGEETKITGQQPRSSGDLPGAYTDQSNPSLPGSSWVAADPRIPARLARTASVDIPTESPKYESQQSHTSTHTRESRYSYRTTDSEWTTDSDVGNSPGIGEEPDVFGKDNNNLQSFNLGPSMDPQDLSQVEWKRRMSDYVSGLPNFALGSTTKEYTHKRPRLLSDNSRWHDAVSLEKQNRRYRRGTTSSSGSGSMEWPSQEGATPESDSQFSNEYLHSTFSRLSSCSSRDSIQHWVDSLDDTENDVTVVAGHEGQNKSEESSVEYTSGPNPENIPGYGQSVQSLHVKKGSQGSLSVDDLSLGADASCITTSSTTTRSTSPETGTNGSAEQPQRRTGPGGRLLQRRLTNSQIIEQAQQHRTIQGRRQQLHHMGGSGLSDAPSDYSIRTASSIAELLLMRNDPEEILLSLGFGASKKPDHLDRIPGRFLQPSRMKGISVQEFLHRVEIMERGYGFNISGGLRGLEYVLDRRRTNSLVKQNSSEEEEKEKEKQKDENKMGGALSKETPPSEEEQEPAVAKGPNLEEIYKQRQPAQIRRILSRLNSSLDSRDSDPLFSSMESSASENDSSFDLMSRSGSLDNCRNRDPEYNAKEFPSVAKDVFHSSTEKSRESSVEKDSNVQAHQEELESRENVGALTEEQVNEIREELMLRAQIARARMVIPSPQLAPVDEESESEPRSPYRGGSLDVASEERMPDGRKLSSTREEHHHEDKKKSADIIRTMSTPEVEMHHQRSQKKSPHVDKRDAKTTSTGGSTGEDSNKLKPVPHKVAERLLKDNNGHGGQESFEIEEISSTENQDESGSPLNKTNEKPSEHGTLSRNPSTQSDSSGFADEGDAPTGTSNGSKEATNSHQIMTTAEVQTSFDTIRLDSTDSLCSRLSSVDTYLSEEDVRRVAHRRESFRKSRGTSIVDSVTFSSIAVEDDDAFEMDDVQVSPDHEPSCGRTTPVEEEEEKGAENKMPEKPRPLRRSGTFPGISQKSNHPSGPKTVPEILTSLQDSIQKATLASQDLRSSPQLADKRKRLMSRMYSVDIPHNSDQSGDEPSKSVLSRPTNLISGHALGTEQTNEPFRNLLPVCEEQIVPSSSDETQSASSREPRQLNREKVPQEPVQKSEGQYSTESSKGPFPQCFSPTLASWDTSDVSSCSPDPEPFQNYSPLLSPPPTMPTEALTESSTTHHAVLPQEGNANLHSKAPSSDCIWQVNETSHLLEQHRISEGSLNPQSSCISELNASCEPLRAAVRLRSSLEIEISGNREEADGDRGGVLCEQNRDGAVCLPGNERLQDSLFATELTDEDRAENWQKVMSSTPNRLPAKKFSQYEAEDIQVLHTALQRYKTDLAELESKSDQVYSSVDQDLTEKDRYELEALGRVRLQIMGEVATMENLLAKKLQGVTSEHKASVDSDEAELLAASAENLDIIREMVSLLEEQRSMQHFLQDLGSHTEVLERHMTRDAPSSFRETSSDELVQELIDVRKEMEDYRTLAKRELQAAVHELKDSIMAEVRREFALDTNAMKHQLQAKDDEIKRLRALLGETEQVKYLNTSSASNVCEDAERRKDELLQLRDLLLKKSGMDSHLSGGAVGNHGKTNGNHGDASGIQSRNSKR